MEEDVYSVREKKKPNFPVSSTYQIRSQKCVKLEDKGAIKVGLAMIPSKLNTIGRNSNISLEKYQASKEVHKGKQPVVKRVLIASKTQKTMTPWLFYF